MEKKKQKKPNGGSLYTPEIPTPLTGEASAICTILFLGARAWVTREKKRKQNKQQQQNCGGFSHSLCNFWLLFLAPGVRTKGLYLEVSLCGWPLLDFSLNYMQAKGSWRKKCVNSPLFWWYFEFWSSFPIHLLLFTFQSPKIAPPGMTLQQWERHGSIVAPLNRTESLPSGFLGGSFGFFWGGVAVF